VDDNGSKPAEHEEELVVIPGGLTEQEFLVIRHLAQAWEEFVKLETDILHRTDFVNGLHKCQRIVAMRVLQRAYPAFWRGG